MSEQDIEVSVDVVLRRDSKPAKRADIEQRLYRALADQPDGSDSYEAIADALALLLEVKNIASNKGDLRAKGAKVLRLLDLSTAKDSLKKHRDKLACALIASESQFGDVPPSVIKDELTILMKMDVADVGKVWTAGKAKALEGISGKLPLLLVEDIKVSISDITAKIGNSREK